MISTTQATVPSINAATTPSDITENRSHSLKKKKRPQGQAILLVLKGHTNAFEVNSKSPLAIMYNDASVLENHHAALTHRILAQPENDVLATLEKKVGHVVD